MSEWPRVCLCELPLSIVDGDRGKNYPKHDEFLKDGFCLFLSTTNVTRDGLQFGAFNQYITREKDSKLRKGKLQRGDIILTTRGTLGNVGYYSNDVPYDNVRINSGMVILRPDGELIDGEFVYSYLRSDDFMAQVQARHSGAAQPQLPIKDLCSLSMPLPSLPVQHRIASILSDYDSAIANARKQIELLEEAAMRLYREWFDGVECEETIEGVVKEIESGSRPKGGAQNSGIPSIGAEKIDGVGRYDFSGEKFISEDFFAKMKRGVLRSEDILVYKDGAYCGKVSMSIDSFPHERAAVNEHVFILRAPKRTAFVYCFLRQEKTYRLLNMLAKKKAAQPGLNQDDMLGINVPFVDAEKAELFEGSVMPMMHRIATLGKQIRKLTEARDRLLPKLMSGEVEI